MLQTLADIAYQRGLLVGRTEISSATIVLPGNTTRFYLAKYLASENRRFDGYVGYSETATSSDIGADKSELNLQACYAANIANFQTLLEPAFIQDDVPISITSFLDAIEQHLVRISSGDTARPYQQIRDLKVSNLRRRIAS